MLSDPAACSLACLPFDILSPDLAHRIESNSRKFRNAQRQLELVGSDTSAAIIRVALPACHAGSMTRTADIDIAAVRAAVLEILTAMVEMLDEPFPGAKSIFPAVWCERASIVVARVLAERGLGVWTFVTAGLADDPAGHAWFELRDESGTCFYSIDVTLDQFPEWDEPFIGKGRTPAADRFTEARFAGPWDEWPLLKRDDTYADYAERVSSYVARP